MMTEPTSAHRLARPSLTAAGAASAGAPRGGEALRAWRVSQLAALGAVAAAAWHVASGALLVAWAAFVILNLVLHAVAREFHRGGVPRTLDLGAVGALGAAWGGALLLLPAPADTTVLAVVLASAFLVALTALPALASRPGAYGWFLLPASTVLLIALARDAAHPALAGWTALGVAVLLTIAASYYSVLEDVTGMVRRFVRVIDPLDAVAAGEGWSRLGARAERALVALHRLRAQHGRDQRLLEAFGDGVLVTDAAGAVEDLNAAAMTLLGCPRDSVMGQPLALALPLAQRSRPEHIVTRSWWEEARDSGRPRQADEDLQLVRGDGSRRDVEARLTALHDGHGHFIGVSVQLRDVSARRRQTARLAWRANHDPMTGAVNRAEFERRLERLLRRTTRARRADDEADHTLLFIDIDKFKFVNDSYGHAAGDYVLRTLTAVMGHRLRERDVLGRLGGDEFCVLLHGCALPHARAIADTMRAAVARHEFRWHNVALPVSISVGVVAVAPDAESGAALLRNADTACYAAKHSGRNRVELFAHAGDAAARHARTLGLVQTIQTALRGGHIEVLSHALRPSAGAATGGLCEIAAGITGSDGTLLPRAEVTELATRFRLGVALDRWLLEAALELLASEVGTAAGTTALMVVPLNAQSLGDEAFLQTTIERVRAARALARRLGFSLPMSALNSDSAALRRFIQALKQAGCRFMINDLGFGGAALEAARAAEFDYLAIPGSFVARMLDSNVDREIVASMSRVAHALGMRAVALDVTTEAQRAALAALGVTLVRDSEPLTLATTSSTAAV